MRAVRASKGLCKAPAHGFDLPGKPHPFSFNVDKKVGMMCRNCSFFSLVGLIANNEPYSRVIVLLWRCENFAPVVYPAAGQSPKRPPTEKENSLGLGTRVPQIRSSPGAEIRASIFVLAGF